MLRLAQGRPDLWIVTARPAAGSSNPGGRQASVPNDAPPVGQKGSPIDRDGHAAVERQRKPPTADLDTQQEKNIETSPQCLEQRTFL